MKLNIFYRYSEDEKKVIDYQKGVIKKRQLEVKIREKKKAIEDIKNSILEKQRLIQKLGEKLKQYQEKIREYKEKAKILRDKLERLKKERDNIKNPERFKMLTREISKIEKSLLEIQENIIYFEGEYDEIKESYQSTYGDFEKIKKEKEIIIQFLKDELKKLEEDYKKINELLEKLKQEIKGKNPHYIEVFDSYKDLYGDLVFSDISDGVCEGCGMKYSAVEFMEILRKLQFGKSRCPYCGRFIYVKPEVSEN